MNNYINTLQTIEDAYQLDDFEIINESIFNNQ